MEKQKGFNEIVEDKDMDELMKATKRVCNYKLYSQNVKLPPYLDKDDVIQDAMFKVFKAMDRFDSNKANAYTYITRIIDNVIIDYIRKSKNDWLETTELLDHYQSSKVTSTLTEQDILDMNRPSKEYNKDFLSSELIMDLNRSLTYSEKQIFSLRYQGYTHQEIATKLKMSRPSVAKKWRKIRKVILNWIK